MSNLDKMKSLKIDNRIFSRCTFLSDYLTDFYTGKSKKKLSKVIPSGGWNPRPPDHHSNALPTELCQHSVASLNLHGLKKSCSIDSKNEQSPTCEVVHETNKGHFRNLLPNRFLPSSVGRALE